MSLLKEPTIYMWKLEKDCSSKKKFLRCVSDNEKASSLFSDDENKGSSMFER